MPKANWKKVKLLARSSVWTFPSILLVLLVTLTAFRISGTSVGVYHKALYGSETPDPDLIYGHPRDIRSDEWLSTTQLIASQSKQGFPRFNKQLGNGRDVSLQTDLPDKDWSTLFKPQAWSFFVLPLENAFAFRWWFLMYMLIVSCYFFVLRVLPGKKTIAILISLSLGLAPFELWWYQSGAFLSIAYAFLIMLLAIRMINNEKIKLVKNKFISDSIYILGLVFLLFCFALLFYPPFQIPVALVATFFLIGYVLNEWISKRVKLTELLKRSSRILVAVLITAVIGLVYLQTHAQVLHGLGSTVYPGKRTISSGHLNPLKVFDGFMMPQLQSDFHGGHFLANQSEDSNFILLMPFLILPGLFISAYEFRQRKKIDILFLTIQAICLLFLVRVFIPFGSIFYKLLLLQKVPNERLLIGMGFIGIIQIIYTIKKLATIKFSSRKFHSMLVVIYSALCWMVIVGIGLYTRNHYPLFINRRLEILLLASMFVGIIFLLLRGWVTSALILLLIFTLASSFKIMPLYRGLGFDSNSAVAEHMQSISKPTDSWATVDIPLFQNMGLLANRRSITGTQLYPDLNFWKQTGDPNYQFTFNREAHVMLTDDQTLKGPTSLPARNFIEIKLNCDSTFIRNNVNYLLSVQPLKENCTSLVDKVLYPSLTVYLYKLTTP